MATDIMTQDPYHSRTQPCWESAAREDPVVWGDQPGPLTPEQVTAFDRDGFHFEPQLIPRAEAELLLEEANRLAAAARPGDEGAILEPHSHAVRSLFRLHRTNERFRQVTSLPAVTAIIRQLLGDDIYIHQSRINFKPAFDGKEFFWHSDFETWHIEDGMPRMRAISMSLNLTENHEFNGPLMVVPGSHRGFIRCVGQTPENHYQQSLKKQQYGVPSREAMALLVEQGGIVAPKGPPGSAVLFDCNLMHGSCGNLSPQPRSNFFVVYNSMHNALVEPFGGTPPRPDFLGEREPVALP